MSYNICPVCGEPNGIVNTTIFQCRCTRPLADRPAPSGEATCCGYPNCDGNLPGEPHSPECPLYRGEAKADARHPAFGPGDYSCASCGLGMTEPCEHWKAIMAQAPDEPAAPPAPQAGEDDKERARLWLEKWQNRPYDSLAAEFAEIRADERSRARREIIEWIDAILQSGDTISMEGFRNWLAQLFNTMVVGGLLHGQQERYSTWEQAEKGHAEMLEKVKAAHKEQTK